MTVLAEGAAVSRYRIVRPIGRGQMGDVYEAVAGDGQRVAVKVMRPILGSNAEAIERFWREARLSTALRHPNVVDVLDHGTVAGCPFLVMPRFHGEDLGSCLERTGALRPEVAVAVVRFGAVGLAAAHAAGFVHRDFKPANLFLDERPGGIAVVVCDFGMAKVLEANEALTASGAVLGTPLYMSPEQLLDSKRVDGRCDVWALGMTLYHALAGRAAYEDIRSVPLLLEELSAGRVPALQVFAPWVQPGLARVVHTALLPLDRRFPTVREFLGALDEWAPRHGPLTKRDLEPIPLEEKARRAAPLSMSQLSVAAEIGRSTDPTVDSSAAPPMDPFIGRVLDGRYRIVARLGSGGMGAVYEAVDVRASSGIDPTVALKVMQSDHGASGADNVRRFLREAKAAQRVQHPHVTRVLDIGVDEQAGAAPFLVMERLRGRDLSGLIRTPGMMVTEEVLVALFIQACQGLDAAHALGIVHRDVKPSNLFVHSVGEVVLLKVCDFGIAKQLANGGAEASVELTRTGGFLGSPLYMSPEQAKSAKDVDARSDVYSLSVSLHQALSGLRPWENRTSMGELILAVCTQDMPSLRTVAPWVPPELARIVERGLQRERELRFASMAELAAALRPFAANRQLVRADLLLKPASGYGVSQPRTTAVPQKIGSTTSDPFSITDRSISRRTTKTSWLWISAVVAALGLAAGGVLGPRVAARFSRPATPTATPAVTPVAATSAMMLPQVDVAAEPSAGLSLATPDGAPPDAAATFARPSAREAPPASLPLPVRAVRSAPPPPAPPTAAGSASVGRGMTATDLPP